MAGRNSKSRICAASPNGSERRRIIHHGDEDIVFLHHVALIEIMVRFRVGLVKVFGVHSVHDIRQLADFIRSKQTL